MSRELVFDIETQEQAGPAGPKAMHASLVGIYTYEDDTFRAFREEQFKEMWPLFERAERLIGYNSKYFDIPVLQNYYLGDLSKIPHLDLLEEIKRAAGFRIKLNDVARATLNTQKSAHGLDAVAWFKKGEWEKIEKYCLDDVRITRDLYEYGKMHKQIFFPDVAGGIKPIAIKFTADRVADTGALASVAPTGMNMTLPF